jgi:hypothetical protein
MRPLADLPSGQRCGSVRSSVAGCRWHSRLAIGAEILLRRFGLRVVDIREQQQRDAA